MFSQFSNDFSFLKTIRMLDPHLEVFTIRVRKDPPFICGKFRLFLTVIDRNLR